MQRGFMSMRTSACVATHTSILTSIHMSLHMSKRMSTHKSPFQVFLDDVLHIDYPDAIPIPRYCTTTKVLDTETDMRADIRTGMCDHIRQRSFRLYGC